MKKNLIALLSICIVAASCTHLEQVIKTAEEYGIDTGMGETAKDVLTNEEIVRGLKDALAHGADSAVSRLSMRDGYFRDGAMKIFLPAEVKPVYDRLDKVPIVKDILADAILAVNRSAEDAASAAGPIFKDAIRNITINDAMGILRGNDTAATHYLREKTFQSLYNAFQPKIKNSLDKKLVGNASAEGTYKSVIDTYNTASLNGMLWEPIKNNSLAEHTTKKALKGLFIKVAAEEKMIRENPIHRVTDILKRVFGWEW